MRSRPLYLSPGERFLNPKWVGMGLLLGGLVLMGSYFVPIFLMGFFLALAAFLKPFLALFLWCLEFTLPPVSKLDRLMVITLIGSWFFQSWLLRKHNLIHNPLNRLMYGFLLALFLPILFSSYGTFWERAMALRFLALLVMSYFPIATLVDSPKKLKIIIMGIFLGGLWIVSIAFLFSAAPSIKDALINLKIISAPYAARLDISESQAGVSVFHLPFGIEITRITDWSNDSPFFALTALICMICGIGLMKGAQFPLQKSLYLMGISYLFLGFFMAMGKSSIMGGAMACLLYIPRLGRKKLFIVLLLISLMSLIFIQTIAHKVSQVADLFQYSGLDLSSINRFIESFHAINPMLGSSLQIRVLHSLADMAFIKDHLFSLGTGKGEGFLATLPYLPTWYKVSIPALYINPLDVIKKNFESYNTFTSMGVEFGLLGMGLYILIIVYSLKNFSIAEALYKEKGMRELYFMAASLKFALWCMVFTFLTFPGRHFALFFVVVPLSASLKSMAEKVMDQAEDEQE